MQPSRLHAEDGGQDEVYHQPEIVSARPPFHSLPPIPLDRFRPLTYSGKHNLRCPSLASSLSGGTQRLEAKVQPNPVKADELATHDRATMTFGLAMTAVFVTMLVLNAIS